MILNVSRDNVEKIKEMLKGFPAGTVFLVDYADKIEFFLDYLPHFTPGVKSVVCFTEQRPRKLLAEAGTYEARDKGWSLAEWGRFVLSKNRADFTGHQRLYPGDESRLARMRLYHPMGPFRRVSAKLHRVAGDGLAVKAADRVFSLCGILMQIVFPFLRPRKGHAKFRYKDMDVQVVYDGGPEKDHYGESPALDWRMQEFDRAVTEAQGKNIVFFIVTGPRHEYIARILDLEDSGRLDDFAVFAGSLYRPSAYKVTERRKTGIFSKGSNVTIEGKTVYSDHCLAVGAGEKELWSYLSPGSDNVQK